MNRIKCVDCDPCDFKDQIGSEACDGCYVKELLDKIEDRDNFIKEEREVIDAYMKNMRAFYKKQGEKRKFSF